MLTRTLGRTGLEVAILGLGCGSVGGLMVRGSVGDQERVVARALELGINYFDTAPAYGDGQSESNLGRVLAKLKPDLLLGTKVRLSADDTADIGSAIFAKMDESLRRLGRDHVDLYQLHNPITHDGAGSTLTPRTVLDEVLAAFQSLRDRGKTRFFGITAIGETEALHALIGSAAFDTAQICFNMLNPSAAVPMAKQIPAQDYDVLLDRLRDVGAGAIGIRALAGGALSGQETRHAIAGPPPDPIGSGPDYRADVMRAKLFQPLVDEGYVESITEAAMRFAISTASIATTLIGIASIEQFETAAAFVEKGVLPAAALNRIEALQAGIG